MIPLQLTIEGLYSYQERQTIDFRELTRAGLFGIFGSVGSGKSSILEAITFALYGRTERLKNNDRRAYNMMNLKCSRSYIGFDFLNHENKKYRITREFKRNSRNFEDVKSPAAVLYEWKNENWVPLLHTNTEEIIGLTYDNFKRTIIIPQGQFKEFLELGPAERTAMMKEIFNLHRFDLQHKVSELTGANNAALNILEGELKGFENVSPEIIIQKTKETEVFQLAANKAEQEFQKADRDFQRLKNLKNDFELLGTKEKDFNHLKAQKTEIDTLDKDTDLFDRLSRTFVPLLTERNRLRKAAEETDHLIGKVKRELDEINQLYHEVEKELKETAPRFEALEENRKKEYDLRLISQMLQNETQISSLRKRIKKGEALAKESDLKIQEYQERIRKFEDEILHLKKQRLEAQELMAVANWFQEDKNFRKQHVQHQESMRKLNSETAEILSSLEINNLTPQNFRANFQKKKSAIDKRISELSEKRNHLTVQQQLAQFSSELHEGKSCPLCGSENHPKIAAFENVETELADITTEINTAEQQRVQLHQQLTETESKITVLETLESQKRIAQNNLNGLIAQQQLHQEKFVWHAFSPDDEKDFELKKSQSFRIEQMIQAKEKLLSDERNLLTQSEKDAKKYTDALTKLRISQAQAEQENRTNLLNLQILKWQDYQNHTSEDISELHQKTAEANRKTADQYQNLTAKEKELAPKKAAQQARLENLGKQKDHINSENVDNGNLLNDALSEHQVDDIMKVEAILAEPIDISSAKEKIQQFRIRYATLKNSIEELSGKLQGFTFSAEEFEAAETQHKTLGKNRKTAGDDAVKAKAELERLCSALADKEILLTECRKLEKRAANLKVMTNLFKGAGFVQYAASVFLRQLCDHANVRFHRMTRNQLSLQLNDKGDFEIIDYLNDGRCRSVKTLSGGQAFQVSLSLALALAESVQTTSRAEKNFFFIDEGFGTQDAESVNVVFETLTTLQKENRIVGIISHVEELKEKIPVSLNVIKDETHGSIIELI